MRDERDAASRRPPPLARRDEASRAPRGVRSLEQRTTLPCGPFLTVHPGWFHRGLVGCGYELLNLRLQPFAGGRGDGFGPVRSEIEHNLDALPLGHHVTAQSPGHQVA